MYNHLQANRRLFIEPNFSVRSKGVIRRLVPDIVICNSREVIAVVEIKYLPRANPKFDKDVESLNLLSKHRAQLSVSNIRFSGQKQDAREYGFSSDMLFVWASIHKQAPVGGYESIARGKRHLNGCFMQLAAETREESAPLINRFLS